MKRLLIYITIITGGVFTIATLAMMIVNAGLRRQQNDSFYTLNHIFQSTENHDLLMIGHSRIKNSINPRIIDSMCGTNSFNSGNNNYKIVEYKLMLESYLASKHPKPKYILMILDNEVLNTDVALYFHQQFFIYAQNDLVYNSLYKYSDDFFMVRYLPFEGITRYNDYMKFLALKGFCNPSQTDSNAYKGFIPKSGTAAQSRDGLKDLNLEPTEKGIKMLDAFFTITKQNDIQVLVYLPCFLLDSNKIIEPILTERFYKVVDSMTLKYNNIKVIDMSKNLFNYNKGNFFDVGHLNLRGANEFSKMIADSLKEKLLNNR